MLCDSGLKRSLNVIVARPFSLTLTSFMLEAIDVLAFLIASATAVRSSGESCVVFFTGVS